MVQIQKSQGYLHFNHIVNSEVIRPVIVMGQYFICRDPDTETAIGVLYDQSTRLYSFWRRITNVCQEMHEEAKERISEVEGSTRPRSLEMSPICHFSVNTQEGLTANNLSEIKRAAVQKRWEKDRAKQAAKHDFVSRMRDSRRKFRVETCDRVNVETQCEITNEVEVICGTIDRWFAPNTAEMLKNSFLNLWRTTPRYTENVWKTSMCLYLTSPKCYKILRQIFTLPAVSSLYRQYTDNLRTTKGRITEISSIGETISQICAEIESLRLSNQQFKTEFTLAIDAFSFQTFVGSPFSSSKQTQAKTTQNTTTEPQQADTSEQVLDEQSRFGYGFLMLLIPHDYKVHTRLVHIALAETGAYNKEIDDRVQLILETAAKAGLRVWFRATDGDPGVASSHNDFYEKHIDGRSTDYSQLITSVWQFLCADTQAFLPISDPLHIFKNVRARFLAHPISLLPGSIPTNIEAVRQLLGIGNALNDTSQIGKMRDKYVLRLFTLQNVATLLRAKEYTSAFLLLPFAAWITVIFNNQIDPSLRIFLCQVSFQLIALFLDSFESLRQTGVVQKCSSGEQCVLTFSESHYAKRMLNTLCAFGVVIGFGSDSLRLDSIGTHLVENTIGLARSTSTDPRWSRILSTYAHSEIRKELAAELDLLLYVSGRINDGGCKLYRDDVMPLVPKPEAWSIEMIITLTMCLMEPEIAPAMEDEAELFAKELEQIDCPIQLATNDPNEIANCGIMARIIGFKTKTGY